MRYEKRNCHFRLVWGGGYTFAFSGRLSLRFSHAIRNTSPLSVVLRNSGSFFTAEKGEFPSAVMRVHMFHVFPAENIEKCNLWKCITVTRAFYTCLHYCSSGAFSYFRFSVSCSVLRSITFCLFITIWTVSLTKRLRPTSVWCST